MDITPLCIHSRLMNCFNKVIFLLHILSRDEKTLGLSPSVKTSILSKSGHSTFALSTINNTNNSKICEKSICHVLGTAKYVIKKLQWTLLMCRYADRCQNSETMQQRFRKHRKNNSNKIRERLVQSSFLIWASKTLQNTAHPVRKLWYGTVGFNVPLDTL